MATALINVFGGEITVYRQPRMHERQYVGFAGAHGLTTMGMGTRGYQVVVAGIVRAATRALCQAAIDAIESYVVNAPADDYTFGGTNFPGVVFDSPILTADDKGKVFHFCNAGFFVFFVCYGRGLI